MGVCGNKRSSVLLESSYVAAFAMGGCIQEICPEMLILGKQPVFLHKSVRNWKGLGVCRGEVVAVKLPGAWACPSAGQWDSAFHPQVLTATLLL